MNNVYAQEVPLYSDQLKVAGRVDLIAEWGGQLAIVDFKTSRKPKERKIHSELFYASVFLCGRFL
jgi:ATP-dependent exoDNAse (exonuclease V) beta subunit